MAVIVPSPRVAETLAGGGGLNHGAYGPLGEDWVQSLSLWALREATWTMYDKVLSTSGDGNAGGGMVDRGVLPSGADWPVGDPVGGCAGAGGPGGGENVPSPWVTETLAGGDGADCASVARMANKTSAPPAIRRASNSRPRGAARRMMDAIETKAGCGFTMLLRAVL